MIGTPQKLPERVAVRLQKLCELIKRHYDTLDENFAADIVVVGATDLIAVAAINRSLYLLDGFVAMVTRKNPLCALALVRLQLDSVMRFYATSLVSDTRQLLLQFLEERPLRQIKSRDGHDLTDKYLREQVARVCPWITDAYTRCSSFVHFSQPHLAATIDTYEKADKKKMRLSVGQTEWSEEEMLQAINVFIKATGTLLDYCAGWIMWKRQNGMHVSVNPFQPTEDNSSAENS